MRITDFVTLLLIMLERALGFIKDDAPDDVKRMKIELEKLKEWRDKEIAEEWRIVREGQDNGHG